MHEEAERTVEERLRAVEQEQDRRSERRRKAAREAAKKLKRR